MAKKLNIEKCVRGFLQSLSGSFEIEGKKIVACVSGGADSLALSVVLNELKESVGFALHICHVNHHLRGKYSDEDAAFVKEFAHSLDVPFSCKHIDRQELQKAESSSLESVLRTMRYEKIFEYAREIGACAIAVGHTQDDTAENLLIRLLRGSGATGLAGLRPVTTLGGFQIIRPLHAVPRSEIEEFLVQKKITWRVDRTNEETKFLRNKIRHELIPLLRDEYNPAIVETLCRTHGLLADEDRYLENIANTEYDSCVDRADSTSPPLFLNRSLLQSFPEPIARRVLRIWIMELTRSFYPPSFSKIKQILEMIGAKRTGGIIEINDDLSLYLDYDRLVVSSEAREVETMSGKYILLRERIPEEGVFIELPDAKQAKKEIEVGEITFQLRVFNVDAKEQMPKPEVEIEKAELDELEDERMVHFDYDKLCTGAGLRLLIRTRRKGDLFHPFGTPFEKKLKEIFINRKVPRYVRDDIALLESEGRILWVVGLMKSVHANIDGKSKRILEVKIIGMQD